MRAWVTAYGLAIGAVAAAVFLRWLLDPILGDALPLVTLFGAVAVAVWAGGYRPALVATVLGYLACDYLFIRPRGNLALDDPVVQIGAAAYLATCAAIAGFGEAMRRAQARARERREVLQVTLASIGDAVITTDTAGRVAYLNAVAEALTGWAVADARGRPLEDVFRIVNEGTRRPVESPAERALRDGVVVGLANHTVLIRKDGSERPIDDSAAPIKDEAGKVSGCVLIFRDVSERRRAERRVAGLVEELREADKRKDEFLATLSHELRNPLAPLRTTLEIIKHAGADGRVLRQARDTMDRQLGQLVRLVDDLLDVSRITHNRLALHLGPVELASVMHQVVEAARPQIDCAGHALHLTLPSDPVYLQADPARLVQVFGNLLNNSSKYTPAGGTIRVTAERQGDEAVVTVEDTGIGIPPDKLDRVFDMFTRVDGSSDRSHGGLGIGLTLVRRLVQMHGGSVEAKSAGQGRGSTFVVRLPALAGRPAVPTPAAPAAPRPAPARRVLVVDDNRDSADTLAVLLQMAGNETYTAHDGVEALAAAERHRPDVVFLDIGMPRLNGLEVCRRVREQPWGRGMAVFAMTGWGQEEDRRKSAEAGFDGHLVKPVDPVTVLELLNAPSRCENAVTTDSRDGLGR